MRSLIVVAAASKCACAAVTGLLARLRCLRPVLSPGTPHQPLTCRTLGVLVCLRSSRHRCEMGLQGKWAAAKHNLDPTSLIRHPRSDRAPRHPCQRRLFSERAPRHPCQLRLFLHRKRCRLHQQPIIPRTILGCTITLSLFQKNGRDTMSNSPTRHLQFPHWCLKAPMPTQACLQVGQRAVQVRQSICMPVSHSSSQTAKPPAGAPV